MHAVYVQEIEQHFFFFLHLIKYIYYNLDIESHLNSRSWIMTSSGAFPQNAIYTGMNNTIVVLLHMLTVDSSTLHLDAQVQAT